MKMLDLDAKKIMECKPFHVYKFIIASTSSCVYTVIVQISCYWCKNHIAT